MVGHAGIGTPADRADRKFDPGLDVAKQFPNGVGIRNRMRLGLYCRDVLRICRSESPYHASPLMVEANW